MTGFIAVFFRNRKILLETAIFRLKYVIGVIKLISTEIKEFETSGQNQIWLIYRAEPCPEHSEI